MRLVRSMLAWVGRTLVDQPTLRCHPSLMARLPTRRLLLDAVVGQAGTSMDFIANATSAIFAQAWTPELQKMVGGKQDAAGLLKAVQAEYLKELSQ